MNYYDTFILIADDSPVRRSKIPESNRKKQTIAEIEYELLKEKPGYYTQDELQFKVHMKHKEIPEVNRDEELVHFLEKSRACMRASALSKRLGWGIYFDSDGKAELVPVESKRYRDLQERNDIKRFKAMKSKK
ncbi:DUF6157 family protein [Virgibacillus siamensis]|uniref:DUF6157 family protein n=1 Tax=Virgibacillus siamensis TaxID=480071 RepID=A0ABP3R413_9BACI